jgi:type IV secretion system protein VirD4
VLATAQLLSWPHSVIVNDVKGELFTQTAGYRSKLGKVYVIDPTGVGHRYDPTLGKHTDLELKAMAKSLLYKPDEGEGEIFTQRGIRMLTPIFHAARQEMLPLLPYAAYLMNQPIQEVARRLHSLDPGLARRLLDGSIEESDFQNKFLLARLDGLLSDSVVQCFSGSDFTPQDLLLSAEPITVYLRWREQDLLVLSPLVRLLWSSLIDELTTTYDQRKGLGCHPLLLLIDEAGRTALPSLSDHSSTVVGRGITLWIAVQDLAQLEGSYGRYRAKALRNNCDTHIYFRPNDLETADYLEHCLGRRSEYAHSETLRDGTQASEGRAEQGIPLLTAQEIKQLRDEDILLFHRSLPPIRAQRLDWRHYPLLTERQALPTPALQPLPKFDLQLPLLGEAVSTFPDGLIDPDALEEESRRNRGF